MKTLSSTPDGLPNPESQNHSPNDQIDLSAEELVALIKQVRFARSTPIRKAFASLGGTTICEELGFAPFVHDGPIIESLLNQDRTELATYADAIATLESLRVVSIEYMQLSDILGPAVAHSHLEEFNIELKDWIRYRYFTR